MIGARASIGTDISSFLLQFWWLCSYVCLFIIHLEELLARIARRKVGVHTSSLKNNLREMEVWI
jgi:hypothetical protein